MSLLLLLGYFSIESNNMVMYFMNTVLGSSFKTIVDHP